MSLFWNEFETIRVVCVACGWFRVLGYSGCKDGVRALIRIRPARGASNVLHGDVLEIPADVPFDIWSEKHPEYRDLQHEAHAHGIVGAMKEFDHMLACCPCPRCVCIGKLILNQYLILGGDPTLATHKAWRVTVARE
jgi:hypothetical protein